jgi:hypothetical protein
MMGMTTSAAARRLSETAGLRYRMLTTCAPAAVTCPRCKAAPGYECRSKTGNRPLSYHAPRRHIVDGLVDDDARLGLLLAVYENLAAQSPKGSIWAIRTEILRRLLATTDNNR